jgi:dephospho-CoA kinase
MFTRLDRLVDEIAALHSKLILLVGRPGCGKTALLSGLEKIVVTGDDIKKALLTGGSPATPDDLRKRFESFLNERCKGKDAGKLRFVIE